LGELAAIGCAAVRLILEDITKDINGLVEVLFRGRHEFWRKDIRDSIAIESWGRSASFIERIDGCTAVDETYCDREFFSVEFPSVAGRQASCTRK